MAPKKPGLARKKAAQRRERRAPFAETTPRAVKRAIGTATTSGTPLTVRAAGTDLEEGLRDYARQRAGFKLGKFGLDITRASVSFSDVSGPKGATTYECRIKVLLRTASDVVVSVEGATQRTAFDKSLESTERAVRRTLDKKVKTAKRARAR